MSEYDYEHQVNAVDMNQLTNHTPEQIAEALFNQEPKDPCSCQILANPQEAGATHLFEILLIILVKGIEILSGDLSQVNLNNMTVEHISNLNPWLKSLGFIVYVDEFDKEDEEDAEYYDKYYCRILIKDKINAIVFEQRKFENNYHFLLNGSCLQENESKTNMSDLYAIFTNNSKVFKIRFNFYVLPTQIETTQLL